MSQYRRPGHAFEPVEQPSILPGCPMERTCNGETMKGLLICPAFAGASLRAGLAAQVTPPKADSGCPNYPAGRVAGRVFSRAGPGGSLLRHVDFLHMVHAL